MDALLGFWKVQSIEAPEGRTVMLIGVLPGRIGEYRADGHFVNWSEPRRISETRYQAHLEDGRMALDHWIEGLEPLVRRCVYELEGNILRICVPGAEGPRPTHVVFDPDRVWCVITLKRCDPPKPRKPAKPKPLLEPGSLIPKYLVADLPGARASKESKAKTKAPKPGKPKKQAPEKKTER
ncbi:MAG: hypothetical protein U0794_11990 [Isosphaeraceae bacterium]